MSQESEYLERSERLSVVPLGLPAEQHAPRFAPGANSSGDSVRSVQRALLTLAQFSLERPALTQAQLISATELPRSTGARLIRTLIDAGWLFIRSDELITLGPRLIPLTRVVQEQWSISESSKLVLESVVARTSETANIYVRDGLSRVCIAQHQSPLLVRCVIPVGIPIPVWLGASGQVLLAAAEQDIIDAAVGAAHLTPEEKDGLLGRLRDTRDQGYAITHGQREIGASSISVPVTDEDQRTIAALAISGPTARFTPDRLIDLLPIASEAAQQLSQTVGPVIRI